jgi:putative exosortase-associated protein (TIGR04073 family)
MNLKRTLMIVSVLMAVGFMGINVRAQDGGDGELPPIRKLSRGLVNVACGALEIPMKVIDINEEENGLASVTYGLLKGISYCIAREVIGVIEIVTFLIPFPEATDDPRESGWGYGPLMRPEWVIDQEHDYYNLFYPDYPPETW